MVLYSWHRAPTVKRLMRDFPHITREAAKAIRGIILDEIDPCDVSEDCARWVRQCVRWPDESELKICAINELLECSGVEGWTTGRFDQGVSYCNAGDIYVPTIALVDVGHRCGFAIADYESLITAFPEGSF